MTISPAQCRAARALLDWSQADLALKAEVGVVTVRQFEGSQAAPRRSTLDVLRRALESAGVQFTNGDHDGVRIKKRSPRLPPSTDPEELQREQDVADHLNSMSYPDE